MRPVRPLLRAAFAATVLSLSCGESIPAKEDFLLRNLTANERLWRDGGIRTYSMVVSRTCASCTGLVGAPVRVQVANGTVTAQLNTVSGQPIPASSAGQYPHVEGLFAAIRQAIGGDVRSMQALYHETLGYPTRVRVDYDLTTSVEDITIDVSEFTGS